LLRIAIEKAKPPYIPDDTQIQVIIGMGFTPSQAYGTLKLTRGDINAAVEKLLSGEGADEMIPPPDSPLLVPDVPDVPLTEEDLAKKEAEEREKQLSMDAENELLEDFEADELQAYDVDLTEETDLFNHYKALILSINK